MGSTPPRTTWKAAGGGFPPGKSDIFSKRRKAAGQAKTTDVCPTALQLTTHRGPAASSIPRTWRELSYRVNYSHFPCEGLACSPGFPVMQRPGAVTPALRAGASPWLSWRERGSAWRPHGLSLRQLPEGAVASQTGLCGGPSRMAATFNLFREAAAPLSSCPRCWLRDISGPCSSLGGLGVRRKATEAARRPIFSPSLCPLFPTLPLSLSPP